MAQEFFQKSNLFYKSNYLNALRYAFGSLPLADLLLPAVGTKPFSAGTICCVNDKFHQAVATANWPSLLIPSISFLYLLQILLL
jgi:hypothetical protein